MQGWQQTRQKNARDTQPPAHLHQRLLQRPLVHGHAIDLVAHCRRLLRLLLLCSQAEGGAEAGARVSARA
jgi:hypothetical protein